MSLSGRGRAKRLDRIEKMAGAISEHLQTRINRLGILIDGLQANRAKWQAMKQARKQALNILFAELKSPLPDIGKIKRAETIIGNYVADIDLALSKGGARKINSPNLEKRGETLKELLKNLEQWKKANNIKW